MSRIQRLWAFLQKYVPILTALLYRALELGLPLAKRLVEGPHKVIRQILGDTDEARYADAGFYLTSTGWTSMSIEKFFRQDTTLSSIAFAFGLVFLLLALALIAKKHKLDSS